MLLQGLKTKKHMSLKNTVSFNSDTRLSAYTLAAAASAAMASSASADIIYSGEQNISIGQFSFQDLDVDGDTFGDIKLKNYVFGGGNYQGATVDSRRASWLAFQVAMLM